MALVALGIGAGDEVITTPNTFIATAEAISLAGATPVFVDIEEITHNMNPAEIERAITNKTKAIIPVHLFGQPADMDPIMVIAQKHGLHVIEDACQAHGAEYKGRRAGSIGIAGCFSFYPGKNLGAYGEGGGIVTNDDALAAKMRMFRDHGQARKYYHDIIGWNARLDGIQGAVLSVKLKYLNNWNDARRKHAAAYTKGLATVEGIIVPMEMEYARHVYHIYAVRVKERDKFMAYLNGKGIACGIHYPVPLHLQKAYSFMNKGPGSFPIAEKCAAEYVSLPMFAELTDEQVTYVVDQIKEYYA